MGRSKKSTPPQGDQQSNFADGPLSPSAVAVLALQAAKDATDALAAYRRSEKLSDTRARNVSRELHEQIKVLKAYNN